MHSMGLTLPVSGKGAQVPDGRVRGFSPCQNTRNSCVLKLCHPISMFNSLFPEAGPLCPGTALFSSSSQFLGGINPDTCLLVTL